MMVHSDPAQSMNQCLVQGLINDSNLHEDVFKAKEKGKKHLLFDFVRACCVAHFQFYVLKIRCSVKTRSVNVRSVSMSNHFIYC